MEQDTEDSKTSSSTKEWWLVVFAVGSADSSK